MTEYNDIVTLEFPDTIRTRPGMFVGNFLENGYNDAPMNLLREVIGNSVDEFMNGHANHILISLHEPDNSISVRDNGRGIPFTHNEDLDRNNLEVAVGVPHSGAKFDKGDDSVFKFAIGMNGIGIKAVNALSEFFNVWSYRAEQMATCMYKKGILQVKTQISKNQDQDIGTYISWQIDQELLPFQYQEFQISRYLSEVAFLNAGLTLEFKHHHLEGAVSNTVYHEPGGIIDYLETLTEGKEVIATFPILEYSNGTGNQYEIALKVLFGASESYWPYVNGNLIEMSSTPVVALRQAFGRSVLTYIKEHVQLTYHQKKIDLETKDVRSGMIAVLKVLHIDPSFDAQTKTKLINRDIATMIQENVPDQIMDYLLHHHDKAGRIVIQTFMQARARIAAKNARENVTQGPRKRVKTLDISLDLYTPPLIDNPDVNDLYLFEGQSASGVLIEASKERDENGQLYKNKVGVLALKGMSFNSLEVSLLRAMKNEEIALLVKVAGLNPDEPEDLSGLNYNRFIIATDVDAGGYHIQTLLTTFFLAHFPGIIEQQRLFRVDTPLYEIENIKSRKKIFVYADEDREAVIKELGFTSGDVNKKFTVKRNKGLGELSAEARMTLVKDPRLTPIYHEDLEEMIKLFYIFSGAKFIPNRRALIFEMGLDQET
ncbi:MAG TPA: hypothetical protein ENI23_14050 [bacterium]|nr:hypothetical protein [bacterium]